MSKQKSVTTYSISTYDVDLISLRLFDETPQFSFVAKFNLDVLKFLKDEGYVIAARVKYASNNDYMSPFSAAVLDKADDSDYAMYVSKEKKSLVSISYSEKKSLKMTFYELSEPALIEREKEFNKFKYVENHSKQMGLLAHKSHGTRVEWYDLDDMELDLELNYGKHFKEEVHAEIVRKLNDRDHGLYLFHGVPGTGKTTYIKYLATTLDKKFIFIPQSHASSLDGPSLIALLTSNPNAILVLEDAETLIYSREIGDNPVISTILNLSDGIIGSLLKTSIILTYNTAHNKIDEAITRKGRLCVEHEFGPLSVEDANALAEHLKVDKEIKEPTTLGDIYNLADVTFHAKPKKKKPIGFGEK